ncbi:hypothetical protein [Rhodococcus rhodochrous]|uniref:Uncharacterized protein n=1 Tax=Rhodococcus rhodochrous KG-21 TaxID=1441923 RepID=A0A0M8PMU4_RHORH|nr:hypothetical protein [Rhodococcus rhodochrous]KOS55399.1 hypothetical protein Z051_14935 [Rhodococcus rhodochrous KG-21]
MHDQQPEPPVSLRQSDPAVDGNSEKGRNGARFNRYAISLGALLSSACIGEAQQVQAQPVSDPHAWVGGWGGVMGDGDGD